MKFFPSHKITGGLVSCLLVFLLIFGTVTPVLAKPSDVNALLDSAELNPRKTGYAPVDDYVTDVMSRYTDEGMSPSEKLYACYDYLCKNFDYDTTLNYPTLTGDKYNVSKTIIQLAYAIFTDGYGQCNNFAAAMICFAVRIGFTAEMFFGYYINNSGNHNQHYWSCIALDGYWYAFDANIGNEMYRHNNRYGGDYWFGMPPSEEVKHYSSNDLDSSFAVGSIASQPTYDFGDTDVDLQRDPEVYEPQLMDASVICVNNKIPVTVGENITIGIATGNGVTADSYCYMLSEGNVTDEDIQNGVTLGVLGDGANTQFVIWTPEKSGEYTVVALCYSGFDSYFQTTLSFTVLTEEEMNSLALGDMNGDGRIGANDARSVLRVSADLDTLPSSAIKRADVNSDGRITASDARKILRYSAELITEF